MFTRIQWLGVNEPAVRSIFLRSEYDLRFSRSFFGKKVLTIQGPLYEKTVPMNHWIQVDEEGYISVEKGTKWVANK